ncbi:MerR family transcriptional regulator [Actinoplanes sp. NPDC051470]|uniref:MerR family transcriptional regulator n=1 Tax=Actinoplanes sp. NPDC051470 TaxID=3157224 RepID=UPI0034207768
MRIGELAQRSGATPRQIRYYEEQDLLISARTHSNYRDYDESSVETVVQIRGLIDAGLSTRVIRVLLPCVHGPGAELPARPDPVISALLTAERDCLKDRIDHLILCLDQVQCYLDRVEVS